MDLTNFDLSAYRVDSESAGHPVPAQAYYIPDFISKEEEAYLLRQINNAPKPKWKNLANRRLQVWGGDLTPSNKLLAQPLPPFLNKYPDIIGQLRATGAFSSSKNGAPNHVIVNEYLPNQGIMPHEDGPSYHPVVATISLGSHAVFHYYRYKPAPEYESEPPTVDSPQNLQIFKNSASNGKNDPRSMGEMSNPNSKKGRVVDTERPVLSLLLEPRSLVITTSALYCDHLHGIDALEEDILLPSDLRTNDSGTFNVCSNIAEGVRVANWATVKDAKMCDVARKGGVLKREARISLTCRDVEHVVRGRTTVLRR
ncbi:hypothetical protein DFH11DRAFT_542025 [Phellopilus nigrolimitatus]|nr:hypothetical protein DFH11DRAFT_542025 [Phellopilus nigrolimitatus]